MDYFTIIQKKIDDLAEGMSTEEYLDFLEQIKTFVDGLIESAQNEEEKA